MILADEPRVSTGAGTKEWSQTEPVEARSQR